MYAAPSLDLCTFLYSILPSNSSLPIKSARCVRNVSSNVINRPVEMEAFYSQIKWRKMEKRDRQTINWDASLNGCVSLMKINKKNKCYVWSRKGIWWNLYASLSETPRAKLSWVHASDLHPSRLIKWCLRLTAKACFTCSSFQRCDIWPCYRDLGRQMSLSLAFIRNKIQQGCASLYGCHAINVSTELSLIKLSAAYL